VATFAGERDELQQFGEVVNEWAEKLLTLLREAHLPDDYVQRWRQTASRLSDAIESSVPPNLDSEHVAEIRGELLAILRKGLEDDHGEPLDYLESALLHLEAIRHIVRDALDQHVLGEHDARSIIRSLETALPRVGRKELANLIGVSDRSIQRILAETAPVEPQRRLLLVGRLAELLQRGWTPEGVIAWFSRTRDDLDGKTVLEAIDDPEYEQAIFALARHGRAQHGS
jgi:hypothetical protein